MLTVGSGGRGGGGGKTSAAAYINAPYVLYTPRAIHALLSNRALDEGRRRRPIHTTVFQPLPRMILVVLHRYLRGRKSVERLPPPLTYTHKRLVHVHATSRLFPRVHYDSVCRQLWYVCDYYSLQGLPHTVAIQSDCGSTLM